jgi:hypothetical protein
MLLLVGATAAGTGLMAATGAAFAASVEPPMSVSMAVTSVLGAAQGSPTDRSGQKLGVLEQAGQIGFAPIASSLTFGPPADLASGWDGTLWAIDAAGAPHVYDSINDQWELFGDGVDAAALVNDVGPAVYFRGAEVYIANGPQLPQPIAKMWPTLPASYQLGVHGAAWANGLLYLFRSGTYLAVPWPKGLAGVESTPLTTPLAIPEPRAGTPSPAPTQRAAQQNLFFGGLVRAAQTAIASPTATPKANATPSQSATPHATTATPTPQPSVTASRTPESSATPSITPQSNATPTATPEPPPTTTSTAAPLTSLPGWPQSGGWSDGVIDGVYSVGGGVVLLLRGNEFVSLTLAGPSPVVSAPAPLKQHAAFQSLPADWLANGFDAGFHVAGGYWANWSFCFKGPRTMLTQVALGGPASAASASTDRLVAPDLGASPGLYYIPAVGTPWPANWNPVLQQAPTGRSGGLWAVATGGAIVSHDGSRWTQQPGSATSVAAGADGSVFAVAQQNPKQLQQWTTSGWKQVAQAPASLGQVTVGTASQVWVRDTGNTVYQLSQGQLQPAPLGGAVHLAANQDGTVWSCNGTAPQAFRFVVGTGAPPQGIPAAASVHKVASTRFGAAHCLTRQGDTTQLYRYNSPYLFASAQAYESSAGDSMDQGLGQVYFIAKVTPPGQNDHWAVVGIDAHTGQQISSSSLSATGYTSPVFDPVHEVVIVGIYPLSEYGPGALVGLDARDLSKVRWTINLPGNMGVTDPTLQGTSLCFTDGAYRMMLYDTGAGAEPTTPTLRWSRAVSRENVAQGQNYNFLPPLLANGKVYAAWWLWQFDENDNFQQLFLVEANAADGSGFGASVVTNSRTAAGLRGDLRPLLVTTIDGGQNHTYLYLNGGNNVWQVDLATPATARSYAVTTAGTGGGSTGSGVTTGLAYADGVLWFGDKAGNLYGLDGQMRAVPNTPAALPNGSQPDPQILTTPLVYKDATGQTVVLVSVYYDAGPSSLLVFDPSSGRVASIPVPDTAVTKFSKSVVNGVVYAAGDRATQAVPRAFAMRVDAATQALRDFIVESQLMQDFDGQSTPNGVARYQTHLTVVDNHKAPLARETVKIWADKPATLRINGRTVSIGPGDAQFASVQTGADGMVTILSGSVAADASDKPDLSAVPLRVWAGFMDPSERIIVSPDREFHNRIATAHATDASQHGADDPTRVNLQITQKYGPLQKGGSNSGAVLFTDAQKQQNQPQQVASAIQTMTRSIGVAGSANNVKAATWSLQATSPNSKYIAYSDLPGSQFSPVNTAAVRSVTVVQPVGLSYSRDNAGSQPPSFANHAPAEATLAIDALDGQDWHTSQYATPRVLAAAQAGTLHLGNWWDDFWGFVKSTAVTITHVIVSVAEDIYAGIRFIVNGVAHVFRAVIADLESAVSAMGALFVELGHLIEEVIQALSVLFHFEEILETHTIMKSELLKITNGFSAAVASHALPAVNSFFTQAEQKVNNTLNGLVTLNGLANNAAGQKTTFSQVKGQGATPHTALSVQPSGGGQSSSQAVQGAWGMNKLQSGVGSASGRSGGVQSPSGPLANFINSMTASLASNGPLAAQWQQVRQGGQGLATSTSIGDFVEQGVAELLKIIALVLDGVLAVTNAFVDGLLGIFDDVLDLVMGSGDSAGLITTPIDFPVLSWLYQELTGEPLTILNALTFVAAIPATVLWRISRGVWPSQSAGVTMGVVQVGQQLESAPPLILWMLDLLNGIVAAIAGMVNGLLDTGKIEDPPALFSQFLLAAGIVSIATSFPLITADQAEVATWAMWGLAAASGLQAIIPLVSAGPDRFMDLFLIGFNFGMNICQLLAASLAFGYVTAPQLADDLSFALTVVSTVPAIVNPIKLGGEIPALVAAGVDVAMGYAALGLSVASAETVNG